MAGTTVSAPQVSAGSLVLTRIGVALVLSGASGLGIDLLNSSLFLLEVLLRDLHLIDDNVLNAAGERGGIVGQNFLQE